jgi:hypothetical protein
VWVLIGAGAAYSQSTSDSLGGMWIAVAIVVVIGLGVVERGYAVRLRRR